MNVHFLLKMEFTCFPWRCNPQRTQYSCHNTTIIFHRDSTASILTCSHLINHFSNLVFLSPTLFCSWILSTDSQQSYHLLSGLQQTQRLMVFFLLKGVGVYSSEGAGRLLFKESIWLDSLTNCIRDKVVLGVRHNWLMAQHTCTVNPPDRTETNQSPASALRPPALLTYLPYLFSCCLFSHKMSQDSNLFKTKSNFSQPLCVDTNCAKCVGNMQICLSDTLYVNLQSQNWMTVSLRCEALTKLKSHSTCRLDEAESSTLY